MKAPKKSCFVYATNGRPQALFAIAEVNGVRCAAYIKGGKIESYEPWDSICRQFLDGAVSMREGSPPKGHLEKTA